MNLADEVYWKVGGSCDDFIDASTIDEVSTNIIKKNSFVLGRGSNILFDSDGYKGTIIRLDKNFSWLRPENDYLHVGAGFFVPSLVRTMSKLGYGGLEHCVGIPATLGGLVVMNGGSQRKFVSEFLIYIDYVDEGGKLKRIFKKDCNFGYRESIFKRMKCCIVNVCFLFPKIIPNSNRKQLIDILTTRRKKFPRKLPSCGSVFISDSAKYNELGPPGMIIENLNLKGLRVGGAEISEVHANFIVNKNNATSNDILEIVNIINKKINDKYRFKLVAEAIYVDPLGMTMTLDVASEKVLNKNES